MRIIIVSNYLDRARNVLAFDIVPKSKLIRNRYYTDFTYANGDEYLLRHPDNSLMGQRCDGVIVLPDVTDEQIQRHIIENGLKILKERLY